MAFRRNEAWERGFREGAAFNKSMTVAARGVARHIKIAAEPSRNTGYFMRRVIPVGPRVYMRDNFTHLVEWGSVNNPPYAPIRRGIIMAGLRYVDAGPPA